ncbi:phosphoribosylglycinamide formyltransferase [Xylariaceae sp. FL0804]|nr:phosphoribosylglycinamide formyltransferase [Xylariaceae sp. FL0804]
MTADRAEARISCLASGNGTNLQALIDSCADDAPESIPGRIVRVTVNKRNAFALERAQNARPGPIPTDYFNLVKHGFCRPGETDAERLRVGRRNYDAALAERILADRPDLIVLAGWMHVFSPGFLTPVARAGVPVINLHPALPGMYDGAGAIKRAYDDFKAGKLENNQTGIMIHYVVEEVDRGEPIKIQPIQIQEGDSLEELEQRIHGFEHQLIVEATAEVAEKIVRHRSAPM